jgi:hypothetical protein
MNRNAIVLALLSAALFGVSTPAAKVLLGTIDPAILAGLLYHHNQEKQRLERLGYTPGCDERGRPLDQGHPWNT